MTPAIVLAAGASTRMGRPKALLQAGDRTFIRAILDTLRDAGIPDAVVVVRKGDAAVLGEVAAAGFGRIVTNLRASEGQLSSLIAGLDAIDGPAIDAALVTLVDVPSITSATVRVLLARAAVSGAPILRAVHQGRVIRRAMLTLKLQSPESLRRCRKWHPAFALPPIIGDA